MSDRAQLVMRSLAKTIEPRYYNRVRLALIRLGSPLRVELPELGDALMVLGDREWLCVDRSREEKPLLAWTDFEVQDRNALHQAVRCTLKLYHAHAGMLMGNALPALDQELARRLAPRP